MQNISGELPIKKLIEVYNKMKKFNIPSVKILAGGEVLTNFTTGIEKEEIFDVMPYAQAVENVIFSDEKFSQSERDFKIGFTSISDEEYISLIQHMGFVAREIDGKKGFKVYHNGKVIKDFLPENEILEEIFGEEIAYEIEPVDYSKKIERLKKFEPKTTNFAFEAWKRVSVKETKFKDILSLKLFVKNGILTQEDIKYLVLLLNDLDAPSIRTTLNQNLFIPLLHKSALGYTYDYLIKYLPNIVSDFLTVEGLIKVVGEKEELNNLAISIGMELNALALEYPSQRETIFKEVSNIVVADEEKEVERVPLGIVVGEKNKIFIGGILKENLQSKAVQISDLELPREEIPSYIKKLFKGYLKALKIDNIDFARYMYIKRENM